MKRVGVIVVLMGALLLFSLVAAFQVDFDLSTPFDGEIVGDSNFVVNVSIVGSNLTDFNFNFNGSNFSVYDSSLVLMMNFDNVSSLGETDINIIDISGKGNDGTSIGGGVVNVNGGKYDGGFEFDGSDDYINLGSGLGLLSGSDENMTFVSWVKFSGTTSVTSETIFSGDSVDMYFEYNHSAHPNRFRAQIYNGTAPVFLGVSNVIDLYDDLWHQVALVLDRNYGFRFYVDGISIGNFSGGIIGSMPIGNYRLGYRTAGTYFNGSMDEVRVFDRVLSSPEINERYFYNLNKYDIDKWELLVNQSKNSIEGLDDGVYTYFVSVINSTGYENVTEERSIQIDNSLPIVDLVYPEEDVFVMNNSMYFSGNFSSNSNLKNATLYIWNSSGEVVNFTTFALTGVLDFLNISFLLPYDGDFVWNYYACNNLSSCNWGSNRSFILDSSAP